MKRVGILGGSFNPVHFGHLNLAREIQERLNLDELVFLPNGFNPFKKNISKPEREMILKMLSIAIEDNKHFNVNPIELMNEGKNYTYKTIKKIKKDNHLNIYFIIGADLLKDLDKWYKFKKLCKLVTFVLVDRENLSLKKVNKLEKKYKAKFKILNIPQLDISSTEIRNKRYLNKSIEYLVPKNVEKFIQKSGLYLENQKEIEKYKSKLKKLIPEKRYNHSLNVMNTAMELAHLYNVDVKKAQLAGLLHDSAKGLTLEEMKKLAKENKTKIPKAFLNAPPTVHAFVGKIVANKTFGIEDEEILEAITKHTTGTKNMSQLDKIIFLADYIEPDRTQPGVEEVRELAQIDLNKAVLKALNNSIDYLDSIKKDVNPLSLEAKEFLEKNE